MIVWWTIILETSNLPAKSKSYNLSIESHARPDCGCVGGRKRHDSLSYLLGADWWVQLAFLELNDVLFPDETTSINGMVDSIDLHSTHGVCSMAGLAHRWDAESMDPHSVCKMTPPSRGSDSSIVGVDHTHEP